MLFALDSRKAAHLIQSKLLQLCEEASSHALHFLERHPFKRLLGVFLQSSRVVMGITKLITPFRTQVRMLLNELDVSPGCSQRHRVSIMPCYSESGPNIHQAGNLKPPAFSKSFCHLLWRLVLTGDFPC